MTVRTRLAHALGGALLAASLVMPAQAQTPPDPAKVQVCQANLTEFRRQAVEVSKLAADVIDARLAREELGPQEAQTRDACAPLGLRFTTPIELTKEDLDIALARKVPACNAFLDEAGKHISVAPKLMQQPAMAHEAAKELLRIRNAAAEACEEYPGATARMYRVELDLSLAK